MQKNEQTVQVRCEKGRVTMLFEEGEPLPRSLPAQDFSVIADMLRELPRVWYEDVHEILKASDKEP